MAEKQNPADGATTDKTVHATSPIPPQPASGSFSICLSAEQWKQIANCFDWAKLAIAEQQPNLFTQVVTAGAGEPADIHAGGKKIRQEQNAASAKAKENAEARAQERADAREAKNQ